jgi:hypothetical protein
LWECVEVAEDVPLGARGVPCVRRPNHPFQHRVEQILAKPLFALEQQGNVVLEGRFLEQGGKPFQHELVRLFLVVTQQPDVVQQQLQTLLVGLTARLHLLHRKAVPHVVGVVMTGERRRQALNILVLPHRFILQPLLDETGVLSVLVYEREVFVGGDQVCFALDVNSSVLKVVETDWGDALEVVLLELRFHSLVTTVIRKCLVDFQTFVHLFHRQGHLDTRLLFDVGLALGEKGFQLLQGHSLLAEHQPVEAQHLWAQFPWRLAEEVVHFH